MRHTEGEHGHTRKDVYPRRAKFFAHRFIRLMTRTCLGSRIGPEACWLLSAVAMTEDSRRYTSGVTFWNANLADQLGMSISSLDRFRKKAVAEGWLHYRKGHKAKCGIYWVLIPPEEEGKPDGPSCEDDDFHRQPDDESGSYPTTNPEGKRRRKRKLSDDPSYLPLNPSPPPPPPDEEEEDVSKHPKKTKAHANGKASHKETTPAAEALAELVAAWNATAAEAGWCPCVSPARHQSAFADRWADADFRENWRVALKRWSASAYWRGESSNGKKPNRKPTFDLFLKPDTVGKIIDGKYDDGSTGKGPAPGPRYKSAKETVD